MAFTFFFRDLNVIDHAVNTLVPEVAGRSKIRIWDAGCAMGPEPYTLAIVFAEKMGNFSFKNLYITATDIDEQDTFVNIIHSGIYSEEETKRIPENILTKYFTPIINHTNFQVVDSIRNKIKFQKHNLLSLNTIGTGFSLILCKNVLLHLQPKERIEVIKMFHQSLAPGGLLAFENTQKMPEELTASFEQIVQDAQLFRKIENL